MPSLFWFRPVFMAELIIAESFFAKKLTPRKGIAWRLPVGILVCLGLSFALPYWIDNSLYMSFMFLTMFGGTLLLGIFCFDESFKNIIFCAIVGYTVQHIGSETCNVFDSILVSVSDLRFDLYDVYTPVEIDRTDFYIFAAHFLLYVWIYVMAWRFIAPRLEKYKIMQTATGAVIALSALIVLIDIIIGAVVMRLLPHKVLALLGRWTGLALQLILHCYNILCCILAVVLILELPRRSGAETELKIVKQLNRTKHEQYDASKKNIELINMKVHDLKYQLSASGGKSKIDAEEIKTALDIYDCEYVTENEALNVVLMEKSLVCKTENINLSVIADAGKLGFMKDADIYALFGNILDNAIEAVGKVKDGRAIGLTVKTSNSFLVINAYNKFEGEIKLDDGLPKTTKADTDYHGYGLKSIKYLTEKYGGEMAISHKSGLFSLTITFQL